MEGVGYKLVQRSLEIELSDENFLLNKGQISSSHMKTRMHLTSLGRENIWGDCIVKYRVVVDKNRCVDCGISTGRCPVHARLLAQVLETNVQRTNGERRIMGFFTEKIYNYVRQLVESCPEKALIIEQVEKE